jgi:quercetin dioxygenase-like cupin family protein
MVPYRWQEGARRILGHWAVEWTRHLSFPLRLGSKTRVSYSIFLGATPNLASLDCHYTVLAEGQTPHPPHVHDDEEIIIPLVGDVDIMRAAAADSGETQDERIGFGRLVYHASRLPHTIRAVGPGPSGYLVLRWSAPAVEQAPDGAVSARSFDLGGVLAAQPAATEGRSKTLIFEGPTRLLRRLHAHTSFARPGEGSAPHRDPHDVAVVVLQGAVETTSGRVEAPGIIFHPAGRTHFLRSVGIQPARYLAIEFLERD